MKQKSIVVMMSIFLFAPWILLLPNDGSGTGARERRFGKVETRDYVSVKTANLENAEIGRKRYSR